MRLLATPALNAVPLLALRPTVRGRLMAWWRGGDTAHSHRKVMRALARDPIRGAAVWGVVTLSLSWSTQESQDWWVSESFVLSKFGDAGLELMRDGQACGLVKRGRVRRHGENGWLIDDSDPELLHIRLKEEVDRDREKSRATRQVDATRHVRLRDGDQCRYCGKTVAWNDRVSARRGTYDHPDPADRDTFVVACGSCNNAKYDRTVAHWVAAGGRPLLPPPDQPYIGKVTADRYDVPPSNPTKRAHPDIPSDDAATPRPGTQPDTAHPEPAAVGATGTVEHLDLDLPSTRVADLPASGRDGPGQVGSVTAGTTRGPSPPRGRRGRRRSRPPPT